MDVQHASDRLGGPSELDKNMNSQMRELARVAMWKLERMWPALYAPPKVEAGGGVVVNVVVNRGDATEHLVIEGDAA